MKSLHRKLIATCALLGFAAAAHAQLYIATGDTGVTAHYTFTIDPTLNQVSVLVDNTHLGVGGVTGTVTSFGFNIPEALEETGSLLSYSGVPAGTWGYFEPYNSLNFEQDNGAGTGNNPNGGQPNDGVQFGTMATFVFQYDDFAAVTGFLGEDGVSSRWQALNTTGGSDRGFGNPGTPGGPIVPVPEPSTYGLIGAAVLMVGVVVRRKTRRIIPALAS